MDAYGYEVGYEFTDEDRAAMAANPVAFGLVLRCGHQPVRDAHGNPLDIDCGRCEAEAEARYAEQEGD